MSEPLLSIQSLQVRYGAIQAVKSLDLHIHEGERVTLIGANGAGKTSSLKALTGLIPASAGDIRFAGHSIRNVPAHELLRQGIAMVPEGRGIFARMSVLENLQAGAYLRRDKQQVSSEIEHLLGNFPNLQKRLHQAAGLLSGGEQQMLALARALLSRPRLLVLDEPSMGLAPIMVERIFEVIQRVCSSGITLTGASSTLLDDEQVRAAYLGE